MVDCNPGFYSKQGKPIDNMLDLIAKPGAYVEIELQQESGFKNKYKLYVHLNGVTILRICKLTLKQLTRTCL